MRTLLIAVVLGTAGLVFSANTSLAADSNGQIPASMLASLGVGSMQHMTDAQGMEIRGKGVRNGSCIPKCAPPPVCERQYNSCQPKTRCEPKPVCQPKPACAPKPTYCRKNGGGGMKPV